MLAAIQPHCDDVPIFAGGTVLKLIDEGYRGILINLSDDSMAGVGRSIGDITLTNENDTVEVAKRLGLDQVFFLKINYHPHSGWFDEGPSKGPFSARVQPKERGRVDARSLITYGA